MDSRTPALGRQGGGAAWVDPTFKARCSPMLSAAVAELGIDTGSLNTLVAVENTEKLHNVVVCTLCSAIHALSSAYRRIGTRA